MIYLLQNYFVGLEIINLKENTTKRVQNRELAWMGNALSAPMSSWLSIFLCSLQTALFKIYKDLSWNQIFEDISLWKLKNQLWVVTSSSSKVLSSETPNVEVTFLGELGLSFHIENAVFCGFHVFSKFAVCWNLWNPQFSCWNPRFLPKSADLQILQSWGLGLSSSKVFQTKDQLNIPLKCLPAADNNLTTIKQLCPGHLSVVGTLWLLHGNNLHDQRKEWSWKTSIVVVRRMKWPEGNECVIHRELIKPQPAIPEVALGDHSSGSLTIPRCKIGAWPMWRGHSLTLPYVGM